MTGCSRSFATTGAYLEERSFRIVNGSRLTTRFKSKFSKARAISKYFRASSPTHCNNCLTKVPNSLPFSRDRISAIQPAICSMVSVADAPAARVFSAVETACSRYSLRNPNTESPKLGGAITSGDVSPNAVFICCRKRGYSCSGWCRSASCWKEECLSTLAGLHCWDAIVEVVCIMINLNFL